MIEIILAAVLLILDQLTKHWAVLNCQSSIPLIPGVLELIYHENDGIAWGLFSGASQILSVLTAVFCALMVLLYIKKRKSLLRISRFTLALIFAGALGNCIDRIFLGYVRDMVYVSAINFPVFNLADSCIVIGAGLFIIEVLFCKGSIFDVLEEAWQARKKKENI